MARWMPFTAHIKIHPERPEKRIERTRELQRLAYLAYQSLAQAPELNLALPGGGQARNFGTWSDLVYGTAVKPQFGEAPPQLMITGFWDAGNTDPWVPQAQVTLIHAGQFVTGPHNNQPWLTTNNHVMDAQVKDLVTMLESTINSGMPAGVDPVSVFRLDYGNVIWGDRGRTFPR